MNGRRVFGFCLVLAFALYFAGSFVFLNYYLQPLINESTDEIEVRFEYAYSFWPGRIHVKGFHFRLQDSNVQMFFEMPQLTVAASLLSLRKHIFETSAVKAKELKFYLRFRRDRVEMAKGIEGLPEIPGVASVEKEPPKPPDPSAPEPWKIHIKGIEIDRLSEFWLEKMRYQGGISIDGGFYLHPKTFLEIYATELKIAPGTVRVRDEVWLKSISGLIQARFEMLEPSKVPGLEIFKHISGKVKLDTEFSRMNFANYYLRRLPNVLFEKGEGKGDVDVAFHRGEFTHPSHVSLKTDEMHLKLWEQRAEGAGILDWHTLGPEGSQLQIHLSQFRLFPIDSPDLRIEGDQFDIDVRSKRVAIHTPMDEIIWGLKIPKARLVNLKYWNRYLPKSTRLEFLSGVAQLSAEIDSISGKAEGKGKIQLDTQNAELRVSKVQYSGNLAVNLGFEKSQIAKGDFFFPVLSVKASQVKAKGRENKADWSLDANLGGSTVKVGKSSSIQAPIRLSATNAVPFFTLLSQEEKGVPGWLPSLFPLTDLTIKAKLIADQDDLSLRDFSLDSNNASVVGWVDKPKGGGGRIRLLVKADPIAVGFEDIGGKNQVRLQDAETWYYKEPQPE